jgi:hypothetical protein
MFVHRGYYLTGGHHNKIIHVRIITICITWTVSSGTITSRSSGTSRTHYHNSRILELEGYSEYNWDDASDQSQTSLLQFTNFRIKESGILPDCLFIPIPVMRISAVLKPCSTSLHKHHELDLSDSPTY